VTVLDEFPCGLPLFVANVNFSAGCFSTRQTFSPNDKGQIMFRPFFLAASLAGVLWASGGASVATAAEPPGASNIGFVVYTKSYAPGTLIARWMYTSKYRGSGIATGGSKEGFAGSYHVRYFYDSGEFSDEYDLMIEKAGDVYNVSWITNGKVSAVGVGMEVANGLAVGWRRVAD